MQLQWTAAELRAIRQCLLSDACRMIDEKVSQGGTGQAMAVTLKASSWVLEQSRLPRRITIELVDQEAV